MYRAIVMTVLLAATTGCAVPFRGNNGDRKAECDQYAAQAIQSESAGEARDLAIQASNCYARLAS